MSGLFTPIDFAPKNGNEAKIRMSLGLIGPALERMVDEFKQRLAAVPRGLSPHEGTFLATLTGVTASVTGIAYFVRHGRVVTVHLPSLTGTSNSTGTTITGLPSYLWPKRVIEKLGCLAQDNTADWFIPRYDIGTDGVITLSLKRTINGDTVAASWTAANTKGVSSAVLHYTLL